MTDIKTKMQICKVVFLTLFAIAFLSCSKNTSQTENILKQAEIIMESQPDSALILLNNIERPETLNEPLYYEYILLMIQARDKNYMDITTDSIIKDAADYFIKTNDIQNAAKAFFYWGRSNLYQNFYQNAINELIKAKELAMKVNNFSLLGMIYIDIGSIYYKQTSLDKCLENYYLAKESFSKAADLKRENYSLRRIASLFLIIEPQKVDSAIFYFQQALEFAIEENDSIEIKEGLNNLSVAYSENKDYSNAKKYIFESIALDDHNELLFNNYTHLSKIYTEMNQLDSALFLLNSLFEQLDDRNNYELYSFYNSLFELYSKKNDYKIALEYHKKALETYTTIMEENSRESVLEIEEKYNNEKLKNEYNQTIIKKQRTEALLYIVALLALITGIIASILYRKNKRKNVDIENAKDAIDELTADSNKSNELLRKKLIEELSLTRKIAYVHSIDTEKSNKFIKEYESLFDGKMKKSLDWNHIYEVIDELYPGFRINLDDKYSTLSEKEKQLCYLIRADFRTAEIAYILEYRYESADSMKYKLRKKAGFNSMAEFEDFLDTL